MSDDSNTNMESPNVTHKECSTCKETKLLSHFTRDKTKKDGRKARCKACQREWNKKNNHRKRESQRKYAKKPEVRYKKYKASAESRGYEWNVSFEHFMTYWNLPCVHCGDPIETIGLDRVDSSLGYTEGNLEPCCSICNRLKSDSDTVDWYAHMEKIRKNIGGFVSGAKEYK